MTEYPEAGERRVYPRRTLRVPASVIVPGMREVEVRTCDISEGGLGVVAAVNPNIGARFRIRFGLPIGSAEPIMIETPVTVARSILARDEGGFKIGLMFVRLDEPSVSAIRRYIHRG